MEIEKILSDLIEIPSISTDTENCKKAIDYIDDLVKKKVLKQRYLKKIVYTVY